MVWAMRSASTSCSCLGQGGGHPGECLCPLAVVGDGVGDAFGVGELPSSSVGGGNVGECFRSAGRCRDGVGDAFGVDQLSYCGQGGDDVGQC